MVRPKTGVSSPSLTSILSALQYAGRAFRVLSDTYVTDTSGTGIVQQAPAFGDDDHRVCVAAGVVSKDEMPPCPIDERGFLTDEVPDFAGQYIKDADKNVIKYLKARHKIVVASTLTHSYPFCWRFVSPLFLPAKFSPCQRRRPSMY